MVTKVEVVIYGHHPNMFPSHTGKHTWLTGACEALSVCLETDATHKIKPINNMRQEVLKCLGLEGPPLYSFLFSQKDHKNYYWFK